jgi:23S rRNA (cytidine1920-2'-O)/16S rRNA (cytidine1409-2'-O)-methyltransferase
LQRNEATTLRLQRRFGEQRSQFAQLAGTARRRCVVALKKNRSAAKDSTMAKTRADQLLVDRGLVESRARAQALILAGLVFSGERKIEKAGQALAEDASLEVRGKEHPWVSRGGIKLAHALEHFGWDVTGAVALDVGSSTGGFTDVLLQKGVSKVFAVDVGTNQLAWKLRQDPRVLVHEKTNARYLTDAVVTEPVDIIVCDASFISLAKVLDRALDLARPGGRLVALVKPQFEAERGEVGKSGVVRDPAVHERVCRSAEEWLRSRGWEIDGIAQSPITGPEGNVEFLLAARRAAQATDGQAG